MVRSGVEPPRERRGSLFPEARAIRGRIADQTHSDVLAILLQSDPGHTIRTTLVHSWTYSTSGRAASLSRF
jgi:hypothetical protein